MPPKIRILLTIDEAGEWKPAEADDHIYAYKLEYSKSGRAKCQKCSEKVGKGEIRVATPIKWKGGEYGYISSWSHLKCFRSEEKVDGSEIWGFDDLKTKVFISNSVGISVSGLVV